MIYFIAFIILLLVVLVFEEKSDYQATNWRSDKSYFKEKKIRDWEDSEH